MFESLLKNKIEYNIMTGNTSYSTSSDDILPKELTQANFRRGKWTIEEENYTSRIIKDFENGACLIFFSLFLLFVLFFLFSVSSLHPSVIFFIFEERREQLKSSSLLHFMSYHDTNLAPVGGTWSKFECFMFHW